MKKYLQIHEWKIIEEGFNADNHELSESIFSLGNGRMGQRANFEETYTGKTLQGNYVAGVYYPDKTRVGWWKNGYPEYFAKVLNAAEWAGIEIKLEDEILDLDKCEVSAFSRELNMQQGYLERSFQAKTASGKEVKVKTTRFCSLVDDECGAVRYAITPLNFSGEISLTPFINGDVKNQDSNYDEKFWDETGHGFYKNGSFVEMKTKKTEFVVCTGMQFSLSLDNQAIEFESTQIEREKFTGIQIKTPVKEASTLTLYKYAANLSSLNHPKEELQKLTAETLERVSQKGFEQMLKEQAAAWAEKWQMNDIQIEGDAAAQQAIRFNIFQLEQTYTGKDARLNIGPKGFTGEKYGGSTYWDTEAYCIPFYLATAGQEVARNLLVYRYDQLQKAIENAAKLGFKDGAALYPMVTMNGEECHNEWEITFEEIHRNGAIAYAVFNYINYTGDEAYLASHGLEVLIGIARFWAQRVNWSEVRQQYVMLGVTGPNEYENNINNNWYTNTIAAWCLKYAVEAIEIVKKLNPERLEEILSKIKFSQKEETALFNKIADQLYFPFDEKHQVFMQQDNYLDKEQILVKDLPEGERPINQKWSWDRILRSCYIKQADVLQGIYFFQDKYDLETIRRNFDFYEARTVHESSLSPCVHAILAAKLGDEARAYEFYLRTARLDLDNYNNDTCDGCHITSMAGTWMAVVEGFGGMRVKNGQLNFNPFLPEKWQSFSFHINFRNALLDIKVSAGKVQISNKSNNQIKVFVYGHEQNILAMQQVIVSKP
ncbi:glycoside hydrolase family 65 protein [Mucilaginibacter arboris]|uniref:Glycoside hydrolase family 65 protein n=1 Tax=Mucilaginibacter arboris TaxID=2682090 RepID=A0A7K1SY03_9SPHI|nr:glycoside hydrolase family 65 protein [Mucilaginibacter arboris]MVN21900.1 glycoside hydrolase family 65 protein [Mucilaginibacter arboris]